MRKCYWTFLFMLSVGLSSWGGAQTTKSELFDLKKSQQELEIMKGILSTTLSFVVKEIRSKETSTQRQEDDLSRAYWKFSGVSGITAFYLPGQGAIFIIPASSLRELIGKHFAHTPGFPFDSDKFRLEAEVEALGAEIAHLTEAQLIVAVQGELGGVLGGVVGGVPGGVVGGVPGGVVGRVGKGAKAPRTSVAPAQAQAPAPQAAPKPAAPERADEMRKKLLEAQEKVKKRREDTEAKRAKFLEQLGEIKAYLIEALANHGDSLTHVKPNEYITIVITTDDVGLLHADTLGARSSSREVVSVQKSAIVDYKTGRLTLDAFKQKVLNYNN